MGSATNRLARIHPADATMAALLSIAVVTAAVRWPAVRGPLLVYLLIHAALLAAFLALTVAMTRRQQAAWVQFVRPAALLVLISVLFTSLGKMGVVAMPYLADATLSAIDNRLCGVDPSLALQPYLTSGRIEFFSFIYWAFLPYLYLSVALGCLGRPPLERNQFLTGWIFTYTLGYLGYIFAPAHGPLVFHEADYRVPLQGGFFFRQVIEGVDMTGGMQGIFPSLHVGGAVYLCLFDLKTNRLRGLTYLPMVLLIYVSTLVLRYHYVIDLIAGTVIGAACVPAGQRVMRWWVLLRQDFTRWLEEEPGSIAPALAEQIQHDIDRLPSAPAHRDALTLHYAADILITRGESPPALGRADASAVEWVRVLARIQASYPVVLAAHGSEVELLSARVHRYRQELLGLGIQPSEVYLPLRPGPALLFVVRELELLLVGSPLALWGWVNHLPGYLLMRFAAGRRDRMRGPSVFLASLPLVLCDVAQIVAAWLLLPVAWAALYSLALPYTGYHTLLYRARTGRAFRRARTFLFLLRNPARREQLIREGRAIIAAIHALAQRGNEKEEGQTTGSD